VRSFSVDGGVHVPETHKPKAASNNACGNARKSHLEAVDTARRPVKTPAMRKKSDAKHTRGFQKVGSTGSTHLECADVQWCLPTHSRDERTRSTPPHLAK